MNGKRKRFWVAVATALLLCGVIAPAGAALVSTDQAIARSAADHDRARVRAFLERDDARARLRALGVDAATAQDRVAGLTDAEVHALAQKIDRLPAGGNIGSNDIIIILLVAILVVLLI
jgi:hypothetical protein